MKIVVSLILLSLSFAACQSDEAPEVQHPSSLIIGDPLECGIDSILLFPIGTSYDINAVNRGEDLKTSNYLYFSENKASLNDRFAEIEFINDRENDFDIRNILFYDMVKGSSYQLISDTIHILSFAIHREFAKPLIFYRIVKTDLNGDEKFNSLDPVMLYVSELDGKKLMQITAVDQHFIDYNYYPQTGKILIKTILDSDSNNVLSNSDETNFVEMSTSNPAFGREIFSEDLKNSLRSQIKL
jgi:hypothetical protein